MASELDERILLRVVCEVWGTHWELEPNAFLATYVYETRDELKRAIELYLEKSDSKIVANGVYE